VNSFTYHTTYHLTALDNNYKDSLMMARVVCLNML